MVRGSRESEEIPTEEPKDSGVAGAGLQAPEKLRNQFPRGLNFTPTSARAALVGCPGSPVRDDKRKALNGASKDAPLPIKSVNRVFRQPARQTRTGRHGEPLPLLGEQLIQHRLGVGIVRGKLHELLRVGDGRHQVSLVALEGDQAFQHLAVGGTALVSLLQNCNCLV